MAVAIDQVNQNLITASPPVEIAMCEQDELGDGVRVWHRVAERPSALPNMSSPRTRIQSSPPLYQCLQSELRVGLRFVMRRFGGSWGIMEADHGLWY